MVKAWPYFIMLNSRVAMASEWESRHGVIFGIDFDTVVNSKLPRTFFSRRSNKGGIEIHAYAAAITAATGSAKTYTPNDKQDGAKPSAPPLLVSAALLFSYPSSPSPKSQGRSHLLGSGAKEGDAEQTDSEIDDRDPAASSRNCANVATCTRNSLVRVSLILHKNRKLKSADILGP